MSKTDYLTGGDEAKETTKNVMGLFEERTNESKEENITLGEQDAAWTRFPGLLLGEPEYTNKRISQWVGAWTKVKTRLNRTRLTKKTPCPA